MLEGDDALALTELKNHRGWKVFRNYLVNEYSDALTKITTAKCEDVIFIQAHIKAILDVASLFENAELIEREARENRVNKDSTSLATS